MASREIEIRLCGSGGQGLLVAGAILAEALTLEGLRVAQSQSFEPTSRGGMSRTDLVGSDGTVGSFIAEHVDDIRAVCSDGQYLLWIGYGLNDGDMDFTVNAKLDR